MDKLPAVDMKRVVWTTEVYEPSDDSYALVDAVVTWLQHLTQQHAQLPRVCLEVGCGSGYVICSIALALQHLLSQHVQQEQQQTQVPVNPESLQDQHNQQSRQKQEQVRPEQHQQHGKLPGDQEQRDPELHHNLKQRLLQSCRLVATDRNPAALEATAQTLEAHQVHGVELVQTDLVSGLLPRLVSTVDLLLFNPPYVPTPDEEVMCDGIARAWAGGHLGRRVTDRLLPLLPELLSPNGHAFIVTIAENKPQEIITILEGLGLAAEIVLTRRADEECLQILHVRR